jgi:hypothetical protein
MLSLKPLALVALGAGLTLGVPGLIRTAPAAQTRNPVALTGYDWDRMSPDERHGYIAGFIAGAAAHQASGGKTAIAGSRVATEAARLKKEGALHFKFGENVYRSHIDDYFFYQNRRVQTLIQVIVGVNSQMGHGIEDVP